MKDVCLIQKEKKLGLLLKKKDTTEPPKGGSVFTIIHSVFNFNLCQIQEEVFYVVPL